MNTKQKKVFQTIYVLLCLVYIAIMASCTQTNYPSADGGYRYPSADIEPAPVVLPQQPSPLPQQSPVRNLIVNQSYRKIGIPYKYGGSTPRAFDCSGLTQYVYREAGITIPRTTKNQLSASQTIPYQQLLPGDLAFYKTGANSRHVGIYIGNNQMIHASTGSKRVRTANITDTYWRKRFMKFGRFVRQ